MLYIEFSSQPWYDSHFTDEETWDLGYVTGPRSHNYDYYGTASSSKDCHLKVCELKISG